MITANDLNLDFQSVNIRSAGGRLRVLQAWANTFGNECLFCEEKMYFGKKPKPRKATIDHIDALSLGGTDRPKNIQVICWLCNQSKGQAESDAVQYIRLLTHEAA